MAAPVSESPRGPLIASCLSWRLSKNSSWSDLSSFQVTASALGAGECEILCAPFKREVSIPLNRRPCGSYTDGEIKHPWMLVSRARHVFTPTVGFVLWGYCFFPYAQISHNC